MEYEIAKDFRLSDLSMNWKGSYLDRKEYFQKKISDLTLGDILWILQRRFHIDILLNIVIIRIKNEYDKINSYRYPQEADWYELIIREIMILPLGLWNYHHTTFEEYKKIINQTNLRKIDIDDELIDRFLNHKPSEANWTLNIQKEFNSNLSIELLGNYLEAMAAINKLNIAILNNQKVYINISNEIQLQAFSDLQEYFQSQYPNDTNQLNRIFEDIQIQKIIKL